MSTDRYDFGRLNVLVVDDNRRMRDLVQMVLQMFGFKEVRTVDSVAEALQELRNSRSISS